MYVLIISESTANANLTLTLTSDLGVSGPGQLYAGDTEHDGDSRYDGSDDCCPQLLEALMLSLIHI